MDFCVSKREKERRIVLLCKKDRAGPPLVIALRVGGREVVRYGEQCSACVYKCLR